MTKTLPVLARSALLLALVMFSHSLRAAEVSAFWENFLNAGDRSAAGILTDFSYAGYQRGEKPIPDVQAPVFRVTDFGAIPNDGRSDEGPIRAALEAAQKAGGGVVLFPSGRFDVWMERDHVRPIVITSPNIVLRGAGSSKGGTLIRAHHSAFKPGQYRVSEADLNKIPYLFMFQTSGMERAAEAKAPKARLGADAKRASFEIPVDSVAGFKPGDWIQVTAKSLELNAQLLAGLMPEATWRRLRDGLSICESHQIEAVTGNHLLLRQPMLLNIPQTAGAQVSTRRVIENVGVEDLAIQGSWRTPFFHHRGMLDDEGWDGILFDGVANGWVRRCSFLNMNSGIYLKGAIQCSLLQNRFSGTPGHYNAAARSDSSFNLLGLSQDTAGQLHAASTGNRSAGTTVWRWKLLPDQSIDSHGNAPYATLIDRVDGGTMTESGGPEVAFPNHLRWMVFWNFSFNGTGRKQPIAFWGAKPCFVKPLFVGLHGQRVVFDQGTLEADEHQGAPVEPESLYEAQLELRLGVLPPWIGQEKRRWGELASEELPDHGNVSEAVESPAGRLQSDFYPEEFPLASLLDDLSKLFSQQALGWERSLGFKPEEAGFTVFTDYVTVRSILHAMGTYASEGQPIAVTVQSDKGTVTLSMPVTSSAEYRKKNKEYLGVARDLALGSSATVEEQGGALVLTLHSPVR